MIQKQVSGRTVNFGPNFPDQSLLRNNPPPPFRKTSDLGSPKFTPEYPPHFRKLQIWDHQSLLQNTPPFRKTSDLGSPKFTPEYPPISENFRFGMTKVYSKIPPPPHFRKLQIWDDQSLLQNTPPPPPISENFRFGMTKVYSKIPPPPFRKLLIWDDQSLLQNTPPPPPPRKLLESPGRRFSEYRDLLHVETLSSPDNY